MSIYEKLQDAIRNRDAQMYSDLLDDDFEFVRHQSGTSMNKSEMTAMLQEMMQNDLLKIGDFRMIYENDDILVEHSVMDFPGGTREAIIGVNMLRDGKITRMETGATPITQ